MEVNTVPEGQATSRPRETRRLDQIARALLYEGYMLWPYRRSSLKNQRRWTIGGVYPLGFEGAESSGDARELQAECLLECDAAPQFEVRLRFLHRVYRQVAAWTGEALEEVDELVVADERYLTWDEAVEREVVVRAGGAPGGGGAGEEGGTEPGETGAPGANRGLPADASVVSIPLLLPLEVPAGREEEWLHDPDGVRVGALVRSWEGLQGILLAGAERLGERLFRVRVRVENTTSAAGLDREVALGRTLIAAHLVLQADAGEFISLQDPPEALAAEAANCQNQGCWPVLVGEPGERRTVLASPIIVQDYPEIAPESPGDLFDGTEIDHLLVLNILGMTDAEKAEMRASDPHSREILDRTEALGPEELLRLFGAVREYRVIEDTG